MVAQEELILLERTRLDALKFIETSKAYANLSTIHLSKAQRATAIEEKKDHARLAVEASQRSLNIAPLNTYAWLRITAANIIIGPNKYPDAIEAWKKSIEVAAFEPALLASRIHFGIILYDNLSRSEIALIKDQLKMAYRWNRGEIRQYFRRHKLLEWAIFLAEDNEAMISYFEEKLHSGQ